MTQKDCALSFKALNGKKMNANTRSTRTDDLAINILGRFIANTPIEHSELAFERSRRAYLDTVGCMFLGAEHDVTKTALGTVSVWGVGDSPVIGTDISLPAPWAALVNGTSAHSLDYDDWDGPGLTHTSAILVPAILASALPDASGLDLFDAHIVGVEVIIRIGEALNMSHYERGWHATNTIGVIGAAAACARILRLDAEASANALSLATSMAGGYTTQFGTSAKPLHAGFAAKSGVLASALAKSGANGQRNALDGKVGFASLMSDALGADFEMSMAKLGDPWGILEYGLYTKMYPSCGCTHLVAEAAENLKAKHSIDPSMINSMQISVSDIASEVLPYGVPNDATEALFSLPWCVAIGLIDGKVGVEAFSNQAISRNEVSALAARAKVDIHPRHGSDVFHPDYPDSIKIFMQSGEVFQESVAYPLGAPERPASDRDVERKFLNCAKSCISDTQAQQVLNIIRQPQASWNFDQLSGLLTK
jgi:2-methylcitrate dehydratase PrpD